MNVIFPKMFDEGAPGFQTETFLKLIGIQYWKEHNLPLWNPYQGYGVPLAAHMHSQPFYPLSAALSLCLTPRTYNWYILLRFFAVGMFTYLFLRFFVSFIPALAGGVACMLAGYYVLLITMPHLSVEMMLPISLWAAEHLLRRPSYRTLVWFAAAVSLTLLGGMPESSLVVLTCLYAYLIFRVVSDRNLRERWKDTTLYLVLSTIAGVGLSAFLLLPFWEYMTRSFDTHQPANIGGAVVGVRHASAGFTLSPLWRSVTALRPLTSLAICPYSSWCGLANTGKLFYQCAHQYYAPLGWSVSSGLKSPHACKLRPSVLHSF